MDELDLFRGFRRGVAAPSGEAQRRAAARLERALTRKHTRARTLRGYRFAAVALVVVAAAIVATLSVSTPWKGSPASFLERAQAALAVQPGAIVHEKWELTVISTTPTCTVERGVQEIWIDQTPPYRYRTLLNDAFPLDPHDRKTYLVCAPGAPFELGGTLDPLGNTLRFIPPNTLRATGPFFGFAPDPVTRLRDWISSGYAEDEGKVQLDGRTVERIRMDPPPDCFDPDADCPPAYAYVDPDTFYPVRLETPYAFPSHGNPWGPLRFDTVVQTITFEYLPRTAANLALTDIRAQHPNATA